jgi:hypothetical protein
METQPFDDCNVTRRRPHRHYGTSRYRFRESLDSANEEMSRQQNDDRDDLVVSDPYVSVPSRY